MFALANGAVLQPGKHANYGEQEEREEEQQRDERAADDQERGNGKEQEDDGEERDQQCIVLPPRVRARSTGGRAGYRSHRSRQPRLCSFCSPFVTSVGFSVVTSMTRPGSGT